MKKIIIASAFGLLIGFIIISSILGGGSNSKAKQEVISKLQMYEMQTDIPSFSESTRGMSLSVYVEKYVLNLMKAGRIVEGGYWSAEENSDKSGYQVSYKFKLGGEDNLFQWGVIGNKITPINGKAKTTTPELDVTK